MFQQVRDQTAKKLHSLPRQLAHKVWRSLSQAGRKWLQTLSAVPGHWHGEFTIIAHNYQIELRRKSKHKKKGTENKEETKKKERERDRSNQVALSVTKLGWQQWCLHTLQWQKSSCVRMKVCLHFRVAKLQLRVVNTRLLPKLLAIRRDQVYPSSNKKQSKWQNNLGEIFYPQRAKI